MHNVRCLFKILFAAKSWPVGSFSDSCQYNRNQKQNSLLLVNKHDKDYSSYYDILVSKMRILMVVTLYTIFSSLVYLSSAACVHQMLLSSPIVFFSLQKN